MLNTLKPDLKEVAGFINNYVKSKEYSYIEEIEKRLAILFSAQLVKFWKVDIKKEILTLIDDENTVEVAFDPSLSMQAIVSKRIVVENHVKSNKYYDESIDNPLSLKMKSIMIFPILKSKNVIGIVKIWIGVGQGKVFNKNDEEKLNHFYPLFLHLFESRIIEKNILLTLLGSETTSTQTQVKSKTKSAPQSSIDKTTPEQKKIESLTKELAKISDENKKYKEHEKEHIDVFLALKDEVSQLENELKTSQKIKVELQANIDSLNEMLLDHKTKYEDLEASSLEIYNESKQNQLTRKILEEKVKDLEQDNNVLKKDLKERKKSYKSIKELKLEKSSSQVQSSVDLDGNIEEVLHYISRDFSGNQHAHIMFEMILYALGSKKGLAYIEEEIISSKLIPHLIDGYNFKANMSVHSKKYRMTNLENNIREYKRSIFSDKININTHLDKMMPSSLVIDLAKIQSSILHLLIDLYRFCDHTKGINVDMLFKEKTLNISIGGTIQQKNSLFKTMFKQTKLGGDEKNRLGLRLSKKIIGSLKGEINYSHEDDYYRFDLIIPAESIKI